MIREYEVKSCRVSEEIFLDKPKSNCQLGMAIPHGSACSMARQLPTLQCLTQTQAYETRELAYFCIGKVSGHADTFPISNFSSRSLDNLLMTARAAQLPSA